MVRRLQIKGEIMKCIHCQGEMKRGSIPFHIDRKGCHLTLDAVLAWICEQCGEAYFDEQEVDTIQDFVSSMEEKARSLALIQ